MEVYSGNFNLRGYPLMELVICLLLGAMVAWAMKRTNEQKHLGVWRPLMGATAASLPYVDYVLLFATADVQQAYMQGLTWSLVLAPLLAVVLAFVFSAVSKQSWQELSRISVVSYVVSLVFATLTSKGIPLFAPFTYWKVSLNILHSFDWYVFSISAVTVASCAFLSKLQRDVARIGLASLVVYITFVVTFSGKANDFAEKYAEAFRLDVAEIHTLPQPLSPMNWRVMIETKDQRIHDVLINLSREEEVALTDRSKRTERIDSLYKPTSKAVGRIYHRFGHKNRAFSKSAWVSMYKVSDQFKDLSKYWVGKDVIMYNSNKCARYIDLRREGSRKSKKSLYMICKEGRGAVLYRASGTGDYFDVFDMKY